MPSYLTETSPAWNRTLLGLILVAVFCAPFFTVSNSTLTLLSAAAICTCAKSGWQQRAAWDGMNSYELSAEVNKCCK